jgi:cellulose synthase/poly-beta-1,6-N-acetylglucosamine synthase-like glycosyltransferase
LVIFSALDPNGDEKELVARELRKIAIIIPFHDEAAYVKRKIDNLKALDYEQDKLDIYFIDGLSTDNTKEEIDKCVSCMPNWHLIESPCTGKIHQINYALPLISNEAEIIVSTDMDAILSSDTLMQFVKKFNSDGRIAVIGANILPEGTIPIEKNYWQDQNLLRIIESRVYSSSIVVAPCYAYKAWLIDKFPEDCIADDIYIAFKANSEGYLIRYMESVMGTEIRTPYSFLDFFQHKFRKGNAYLIELFRFLYRLPYMCGWWKVIYLTKLLQLAVIPWVLPYFLLSTISLALSGWGLLQVAIFGLIFITGSLLITSFLLKNCRSEYLNVEEAGKRSLILPFLISNLILIIVGLSFPFYRQNSCYSKIGRSQNKNASCRSRF